MTLRREVDLAVIPAWLLRGSVSANAVRLYGLLQVSRSLPTRKELAEAMSRSVDTVDRAMQELQQVGAVEVKARFDDDGQPVPSTVAVRVLPGQQVQQAIQVTPSRKVAAPHEAPLSHLLADLVEENGAKRPTVTRRWVDAERLMFQRDGRDPREAEALVRWCQKDSFWSAVVLSMPKFREKYDSIKLQVRRKGAGRGLASRLYLESLEEEPPEQLELGP